LWRFAPLLGSKKKKSTESLQIEGLTHICVQSVYVFTSKVARLAHDTTTANHMTQYFSYSRHIL